MAVLRLWPARVYGWVACLSLWLGACGEPNQPPSLSFIGEQQVVVGESLEIVVQAADPDGDHLEFSLEGLPGSARLSQRSASEAVLVFSPVITDAAPGGRRYEATIRVSDGRGGEAAQYFGVSVYPAFGVPVFELPAGIALDLGQEGALDRLVSVKDDDSRQVAIALVEAPDGARLTPAGPKSAHFYWRPDEAQREVAVHRVIFEADDGDHPPVRHNLTVVLTHHEKKGGCDGTPPYVIHHAPDDSTLDDGVLFEAQVLDMESHVRAVALSWRYADTGGPFRTVAFNRLSNDAGQWGLYLDDMEFGRFSEPSRLIEYYIEATDSDDPTGVRCNQHARFPKVGVLTVALYRHDTGTCLDDAAEPDGSVGQAPTLGEGFYTGRRLCGDDSDWVALELGGVKEVAATLYWASEARPEMNLRTGDGRLIAEAVAQAPGLLHVRADRGGHEAMYLEIRGRVGERLGYQLAISSDATGCADDGAEPDSTQGQARPLPLGQSLEQRICPGDSDYFSLDLRAGVRTVFRMDLDHAYGDLDMVLLRQDGTLLASATSERSVERFYIVPTRNERVFLRVYGVGHASNAYRITAYEEEAEGCHQGVLGDRTQPERAALLIHDVYEGFTVCDGAPSYFAVDLNDDEIFGVLAVVEQGPGLKVDFFRDPEGGEPVVSTQSGSDGFAEATIQVQGPERIYYRVSTDAPKVEYAILPMTQEPSGPCRPDRMAPHTFDEPAFLEPGLATWLRACDEMDEGVFLVHVPAFTHLHAFAHHEPSAGNLALELYSEDGVTLASGGDIGGWAELDYFSEEEAYFLLVAWPDDLYRGLTYDLGLWLN